MRGFKIEGTAFDKPFDTDLEGIGIVNFSVGELKEIEAAGREAGVLASKVQPLLDELNALNEAEDEGPKAVPPELQARVDKATDAMNEAVLNQTWLMVKHAFCLSPSGDPLPIKSIDELRQAGPNIQKRLHRAYFDAMERLGKQD